MICALEAIRDAVKAASVDADITRAYLFGSYARGDASDASDVDLCLETGKSFTLFNAGAFVDKLERELGKEVEVSTERSLFPAVRERMIAERVLLYERA